MKLSEDQKIEAVELLAEIEHRNTINPLLLHKYFPLQQLFAEDPTKTKFVCGGNRAGKSEGVARYVIEKCLSKDKQRWWVAGTTFQDSVTIQQTKIWGLCPKHRIKYGKYDVVNGFVNRKLLFDNGSLIVFKSFDQGRETFQGAGLHGVWLDEEPPLDIYQECKMRLLDFSGEMVVSMTSIRGMTELVTEIFEEYDTIKSQYADLVDKELPRIAVHGNTKLYFLWTQENIFINQERVIEEAKLLTTQEITSRIYGLPTTLTGRIYVKFNKQIHVLSSIEDMPAGKYTLYHVLDPHDRKPWFMTWWAVHRTGSCYCVDEYPNRNFNEMTFDDKTYEEYSEVIKAKERYLLGLFGVKEIHKRIIDPNFGNKTVQLVKRQGGSASTTPKKELAKRDLYYVDSNDALESGHLKVREGLHYEEKDGEIIVHPKLYWIATCDNSIRHMSRYSRKDIEGADGDVKDKVAPQEKYKDGADNTRYFYMSNPQYVEDRVVEEENKKRY